MDINFLLTVISLIFAAISLPASIDYYPRKFPIIKKVWHLIINDTYSAKIKGIKKYNAFNYDLKSLKMKIHKRYQVNEIKTPKKNNIIVSIKNMQATYKISFLPNYDNERKLQEIEVKITLEGIVKFNYRANNNLKYLNTIDEMFTIIEEENEWIPIFKWFSLDAYTTELKNKPFKNDVELMKCEDTKIEIDKSNKYMRINSNSINNLITCLDSNIKKII